MSSQNVLLFTSAVRHPLFGPQKPAEGAKAEGHYVFVADLNTPWDLHLVTSGSEEVTVLTWDEAGSTFVLADAEGNVEVWAMVDHVLSSWKCLTRESFASETFLQAKFAHRGKKVRVRFPGLVGFNRRDFFFRRQF